MCGRYLIQPEDGLEELENIRKYIESRFGAEEAARMKTGEIFPSNVVPVVLTAEGGFVARPMTWGFPSFNSSRLLINARAETAHEKKTFREALSRTRCIVPTSGFYEWSHDDKGKAVDKFLFRMRGTKLLYLAGLYKEFEDGLRFVILTQAANGNMAPIHNRQPVVVPRDKLTDYINSQDAAAELLLSDGPAWEMSEA